MIKDKNLVEILKKMAEYIAIEIRKHEDVESIHVESLSDSQMKRLNISNTDSIYTALYSLYDMSEDSKRYVELFKLNKQQYWKKPKLTENFKDYMKIKFKNNRISYKNNKVNSKAGVLL